MNLTDTLFPGYQKTAALNPLPWLKSLGGAVKSIPKWFKKVPAVTPSWPTVSSAPAASSAASSAVPAAASKGWVKNIAKKSILPSTIGGVSYATGMNTGRQDAEALAQGAAATAAAQTAAQFRSFPGRIMNLLATDDMIMDRMRQDPMGNAVANAYKTLRARGNQGKLTQSEMLKLMRENIDPSEMSWIGRYGLDRKIKNLESQRQ